MQEVVKQEDEFQVINSLRNRYVDCRALSEAIASPLSAEDAAAQSMPDVSPTRWHLAHTTWFFETFLLKSLPSYKVFDPQFEYLFNSYYNSVGKQYPRSERGSITRPGLQQTLDYRAYVDEQLLESWKSIGDAAIPGAARVVELGIQHEQQHQELMLTDIKHVLSRNPLWPAYQATQSVPQREAGELRWLDRPAGLSHIGISPSGADFAFDNEQPRHKHYLHDYQIASRCVTNAEYLEFMADGGYERPEFWLSQGWGEVQDQDWTAPLYWLKDGPEQWSEFTLAGLQELNLAQPVTHVSYFEADAFARWADCRLPTEFEWEDTCADQDCCPGLSPYFADKILADDQTVHPLVEHETRQAAGMLGNVWEWTSSQYTAYPGYSAPKGPFGEYNGKFMCNQFVLRGGSCATSTEHIRSTYRNFFPPQARWQFSGIRLAR